MKNKWSPTGEERVAETAETESSFKRKTRYAKSPSTYVWNSIRNLNNYLLKVIQQNYATSACWMNNQQRA